MYLCKGNDQYHYHNIRHGKYPEAAPAGSDSLIYYFPNFPASENILTKKFWKV